MVVTCKLSFLFFSDSIVVISDSTEADAGEFSCSGYTALNIFSGAVMEMSSSGILLDCDVFGAGDLSLSCAIEACDMVLGVSTNSFATLARYHLSNAELMHVQTSGSIVIGSESSSKNLSNLWIDGMDFASNCSSLTFATSQGSVAFINTSSSMILNSDNASLALKAAQNISVMSELRISLHGTDGEVTVQADSDCSIERDVTSDAHFVVGSSGSLTFDTLGRTVSVSVSSVDIGGLLNVSLANELRLEGTYSLSCCNVGNLFQDFGTCSSFVRHVALVY